MKHWLGMYVFLYVFLMLTSHTHTHIHSSQLLPGCANLKQPGRWYKLATKVAMSWEKKTIKEKSSCFRYVNRAFSSHLWSVNGINSFLFFWGVCEELKEENNTLWDCLLRKVRGWGYVPAQNRKRELQQSSNLLHGNIANQTFFFLFLFFYSVFKNCERNTQKHFSKLHTAPLICQESLTLMKE